MLVHLHVKNLALIEDIEVEFGPGLNILTGETGAGKSILIDSINAILGNRTSKDLVRTGASKAVIRASFAQIPDVVLDKLEAAGYERSAELLLSRASGDARQVVLFCLLVLFAVIRLPVVYVHERISRRWVNESMECMVSAFILPWKMSWIFMI